MMSTFLKYALAIFIVATLGFGLVTQVRALSHLDGMRTGRTTLLLAAAVQPVRQMPQASWSTTNSERVETGFDAAMSEAAESVEALEWVESYAKLVDKPERQAAARALRCTLEKTESLWLSVPRKLTRLIIKAPAFSSKC
jgi:hypothetical protein